MLKTTYTPAFIVALLLHALFFSLLLVDMKTPLPAPSSVAQSTPVVHAISVNADAVEHTLAALKTQQQRKVREQERMARQARQLKQQRQREQARLHALQKKTRQAEKEHQQQKQRYAKKLAQLKQRRLDTETALKKAQAVERQKEQQQLAAIRQQTALRAKAMREEQQHAQTHAEITAIAKYKTMITQAISQRWLIPDNVKKQTQCRLQIRLAPGGTVLSVTVLKGSGNAVLDRSAVTAVYKSSPLPVPKEASLFNQFRVLNLTVRPEGSA